MAVKKLSSEKLKEIVKEELQKVREEFEAKSLEGDAVDDKEADEVEAKDLANTLEKPLDMVKQLKIKESRLRAQLKEVITLKNKILKTL